MAVSGRGIAALSCFDRVLLGDSFGDKMGVTVRPEQMAKAAEKGSFIKRSLSNVAALSC